MKKNIIKVMKENNGIMTTSEIENYGYSRTNISDFVRSKDFLVEGK